MTVWLKVIGEKIFPLDYFRYNPKQPSRKVFNSDWDKVFEYQHEIANHFRDYKNRKTFNRRLKRNRRHHKVVFEEQAFAVRDVLPLSRLNFPVSNSETYHNLFKNCYGNTLRKISSANSIRELRFLTKRQERLFKHKTCSFNQELSNHRSIDPVSTPKARFIKKSGKHNLGYISCTETSSSTLGHNSSVHYIGCNKVIFEGVSVEKHTKETECSNDIENCFFRLASECYDEGFLSHIKYLKSIVDHNSIKKTTSKRTKLHYKTEITKPNSQPPSVFSSASSNNSVEDLSKSVCVGRFASAVNRLLKNRQSKHNLCKSDRRDLKICVNITRSVSLESLNSNRSSGHKAQDYTTANHYIMSEFLNAAEPVSREIVDANTGSNVKRQHFHDLIENLNKLEISDSGLLPKITISLADDNVISSLSGGESNNRTFQKQDSLEIATPFSNDFYSSEARPP